MNLQDKLKDIENTIKPTLFTMTKADMDYVVNTLGINELDTYEELTNLRNSVVKHYQILLEEVRSNDYFGRTTTEYVTLISSITHCVDLRIAELGFME